MVIGCQCASQATILHNDKGDAVSQPPFFVGAFLVVMKGARIQLVGDRDNFDGRIFFERSQQLDGCLAVAEFGQCVADFQYYRPGGDELGTFGL